ncbi:MAG: pseudouridine synthase [Desulfobacteraceae bacterium]|jgi:23S rRNA pseudouridine2605 synthase/23S rRNA pseudouridine2604 synthase|nr:pseudouridine synthase [Desulfobacteraceae bacterium]
MRLQKFLSQSGVCSRRQGEALIAAGRVAVNGQVVTTLGTVVDPQKDRVKVDGRDIAVETRLVYLILHKPVGVVTSCRHPGQRVVTDLVDLPQRIFPVGRLDKDSAGLLLLTNDGRIHHRLSHPSFDHEKEYVVDVNIPLTGGMLEQLAAGIVLDGRRTRPAKVVRLGTARFRIVLKEGRNRQIRRMVETVGGRVEKLRRVRFANLRLGDLKPGQWRFLSAKEIESLLKAAGVSAKTPSEPRRR